MPFIITSSDDENFDNGDESQESADGAGLSLRESLGLIGAGGMGPITFDNSLSNSVFNIINSQMSIGFDLTLNALNQDITITNNLGSDLFEINAANTTFTNNGLTLAVDATGTGTSGPATIYITADDVTFTNNGSILSTGDFGPIGDVSEAMEIKGNNFIVNNLVGAKIISTGRFAIDALAGFPQLNFFGTITNAGLMEAADDTIRMDTGHVENSGTIRTTGATDLNGTYEAAGAFANAISVFGGRDGFIAPPEGVVSINNLSTGVIEGWQAAIRIGGGGTIENAGSIHGKSSSLLISGLIDSVVSFTLNNSGNITSDGDSLGLGNLAPASLILTGAHEFSTITVTNTGTISAPTSAISSFQGMTLTNQVGGVINAASLGQSGQHVAFAGGHEASPGFEVFLLKTNWRYGEDGDFISAQPEFSIASDNTGFFINGQYFTLRTTTIITVLEIIGPDGQPIDAPYILPLFDIAASSSVGQPINQVDENNLPIYPEQVDVPTADYGVISITNPGDNNYIATDANGNTFSIIPTAFNNDDIITNDGSITGDILTGMGDDLVINRSTLNGDVHLGSGNDEFDGTGSSQAHTVNGGTGDDTLKSGTGNDIFSGGLGADHFIFLNGNGTDHITDFEVGIDIISLRGVDPYTSLQDIRALMTEGENHVLLDMGNGDTIRIDGVTIAELTSDHFTFGNDHVDGNGPFREGRYYYDDGVDKSASAQEKPDTVPVSEPLSPDSVVLETNTFEFKDTTDTTIIADVIDDVEQWFVEGWDLVALRNEFLANLPSSDIITYVDTNGYLAILTDDDPIYYDLGI